MLSLKRNRDCFTHVMLTLVRRSNMAGVLVLRHIRRADGVVVHNRRVRAQVVLVADDGGVHVVRRIRVSLDGGQRHGEALGVRVVGVLGVGDMVSCYSCSLLLSWVGRHGVLRVVSRLMDYLLVLGLLLFGSLVLLRRLGRLLTGLGLCQNFELKLGDTILLLLSMPRVLIIVVLVELMVVQAIDLVQVANMGLPVIVVLLGNNAVGGDLVVLAEAGVGEVVGVEHGRVGARGRVVVLLVGVGQVHELMGDSARSRVEKRSVGELLERVVVGAQRMSLRILSLRQVVNWLGVDFNHFSRCLCDIVAIMMKRWNINDSALPVA